MNQEGLWGQESGVGDKSTQEKDPKESQPRIKKVNRKQLHMRVVDVEDLVAEDHPVRAIWELVGRLDLGRYYQDVQALEGYAGRPAMDPKVLLCVWVYAYSTGVGSARQIARLCEYDPAYQWLTGLEVINYHSLSDFRVHHKEGLDDLFAQILGLLSSEGLITLERVMQDGTRIKASAGSKTFRRKDRIRKHLEVARRHVAEIDRQASEGEIGERELRSKQVAAEQRVKRLESALKEFEQINSIGSRGKQIRVSTTDPDARVMKQSDGGFCPSYNAQISTDASEGIIVGAHVSKAGNDSRELRPGVEQVERNIGRVANQVVADGSYNSLENIISLEGKGIDFISPIPKLENRPGGINKHLGIDKRYRAEAFVYSQADDSYRCPGGEKLRCTEKVNKEGRILYRYKVKEGVCQRCEYKDRCCPNTKTGRSINRTQYTDQIKSFIAKMQTEEAKQAYKERSAVAEFSNAWIKEKIRLRQFSLRGLVKVGIELLWVCLTYNIQQWIRLIWRPQFAAG